MDNQTSNQEDKRDSGLDTSTDSVEVTVTDQDQNPQPTISQEPELPPQVTDDASHVQPVVAVISPVADPQVSVAPETTLPQKPKRKTKTIVLIAVLAIIIVLGIAGALVYFFVLKKDPAPVLDQTTNSQIKTETEAIGTPVAISEPTNSQFTYIDPVFIDLAVQWQTPSAITLQGFFKNEVQGTSEYTDYVEGSTSVSYFLGGTLAGGRVIYAQMGNGSSIDSATYVFIKYDSAQKAELYLRYSQAEKSATTTPESILADYSLNSEKVTVNLDSIITGTWAQEKITFQGQKLKIPKYSFNSGSINLNGSSSGTKVGTIAEGDMYELSTQKDGYKLSLFELELPNHFRVSYTLDGEISRSEIPPITWKDGTKNADKYESFGAGCGGGYYSLIADISKDQLNQIGTSDGGQPIYIFKDMTQKVAAQLLSEVNARNDDPYVGITEGTDPPFTADEFLNARTVIIVEDGLGRMVVFKNGNNFISGGCAKPVIYLYPEKPTTLSIQVGADVTISDPQYESNGWQNVTAYPSGQLSYQGKAYDSLFWEGKGYGRYPDRSSEGVVVPRANAVAMMYLQLAQQGFNQKESDDFVEFWSLNIPSGNYVRLTWLSTADMNQLAPLYLSVKPTTTIRTFLEMEGLDSPKQLQAQTFRAPTRIGFTVTEWGGLAVNGLQSLSYPND